VFTRLRTAAVTYTAGRTRPPGALQQLWSTADYPRVLAAPGTHRL